MPTPVSFADLSQQLGITAGAAGANTAFERTPQQMAKPVAPGPLDFVKNVAQSAMSIPGQVAGGIAGSVVKGFHDVAGGISEALTAGGQNNANDQYRQAIQSAGDKYHQLYTSGKMSKDQYTKLSQGLIKQSQDLSGQISGEVSKMVTPKDFATGLATVGSLPFAGGRLAAQAGTGALAKTAAILGGSTKAIAPAGATIGERAVLAAKSAIKAPVKYGLVTQPVAQAPIQIASDLKSGNYAGAAGNAALLAAPGIIGGVAKKVAPILKEAAFGKSAVLTDALGPRVSQFAQDNPKLAPVLKQMEQFTLNQPAVQGDAKKGGQFLANHLAGIGVDPKGTDLNKIVSQFQAYAKNVGKLDTMKAAGAVHESAVVSADYTKAIPKVADALKGMESASTVERVAATNKALDEAGITNQTVRDAINNGVHSGASVNDIKAMLVDQKQIIPGVKLDKGFIATYGPKEQAKLPSLADARAAGAPDMGKAANPILGAITGGLRKAGLGLENYNPTQIGTARDTFTKSVNDLNVQGANGAIDGKAAYKALGDLTGEKRLTDIRQLRSSEIQQTLGVSPTDARKIMDAAKNMYSDVPLSVRGLSGKLQDANMKLNPLAPGYARVQSALRYSYNPAFRAQQKIEAATLGQVATGGHAITGDVTKTLSAMRSDGLLPAHGSFAGEMLHDTAGATNVTTHLTLSEEKSLAHVLEATASKNGRSVQDELKDEATRQLLRAIVQNPKTGILSSNFAKAANLAFFPSAYNAKVTSLAVQALVKQPPAVQFGVLKNINDFHNWMKTDDGIKWQSKNSEAIGLLSYFTPINSVQQTMNFLGTGDVRQLGLVGGLPFGVITRLLEGQGAIPKSNPPYLDPKTGQLVPDKIPQTLMARAQTAAGDILDTMFTFPGRTAGLGSKTDLRNTLTGNVLKPAPSGVKSIPRTGELSPADLNKQRVLGTSTVVPSPRTVPTLGLQRPKVTVPPVKPIFKSNARGSRGKVLAKRIGQPF